MLGASTPVFQLGPFEANLPVAPTCSVLLLQSGLRLQDQAFTHWTRPSPQEPPPKMSQTWLVSPRHQLIETDSPNQLPPGHAAHEDTQSHHLLGSCTGSTFSAVIHRELFYGLHLCVRAWNSTSFIVNPFPWEDKNTGLIYHTTLH